jgi:hypothetical protein
MKIPSEIALTLSNRLQALSDELNLVKTQADNRQAEWLSHAHRHPLDTGAVLTFAAETARQELSIELLKARRMEIFHVLEVLTK